MLTEFCTLYLYLYLWGLKWKGAEGFPPAACLLLFAVAKTHRCRPLSCVCSLWTTAEG
jgi:hypothetical protein